jgi:hypothetical protein
MQKVTSDGRADSRLFGGFYQKHIAFEQLKRRPMRFESERLLSFTT